MTCYMSDNKAGFFHEFLYIYKMNGLKYKIWQLNLKLSDARVLTILQKHTGFKSREKKSYMQSSASCDPPLRPFPETNIYINLVSIWSESKLNSQLKLRSKHKMVKSKLQIKSLSGQVLV